LSGSTGGFFSCNSSAVTKFVPSGQTIFFCYLVNISEEQEVEFRRSISIEVENTRETPKSVNNYQLRANSRDYSEVNDKRKNSGDDVV